MSSRKADRMNRRHKRASNKGVALNLTSLMDIFTILVFFLLVNSSQEQPSSNRDIVLPLSTADKELKQSLTVMVTSQDIIVQGEKVDDVKEVSDLKDDLIPNLSKSLKIHAASIRKNTDDPIKASEITIMAHQEIPYKLLRKLMYTCTDSLFSRISLVVMKKAGDKSSE